MPPDQRQEHGSRQRPESVPAPESLGVPHSEGKRQTDHCWGPTRAVQIRMRVPRRQRMHALRQSKNKYRRQNAHVAERKPPPPSPSQACSVDQRPYNGYATPRSDESRTRRSTIKELCKGSTQQRRHKVTDKISDGEQKKKSYSQSQNPYVTPSSPDFSTVRARQRRKRKDIARQKRRLDWDSTYLESRAVSQPTSSRLRSSTGIHGKRKI